MGKSWPNQDGWSPNLGWGWLGGGGEAIDLPRASPTKSWSQGWPGLGLGLGPGLQQAAWLTCSDWEREDSKMGGSLFICLFVHF